MAQNDLIDDFAAYCKAHPELRFWQALRNWSGQNFILASRLNDSDGQDTFYWTEKDEMRPAHEPRWPGRVTSSKMECAREKCPDQKRCRKVCVDQRPITWADDPVKN
jgi:hypothetical protein